MVLILGFLLCAGLSWSVSMFGSWMDGRGMADWDERWLRWLDEEGPMGFTDAIIAESPGNLSYLVPLTTLVALLAWIRGRTHVGLGILVAYWGARPLVFIGWQAWNRARPDLIAEGVASPALHSFPSGHAALSTAAYGFLAYLWIQASRSGAEKILAVIVTIVWILFISWGRLCLGAHWPSDIAAGLIVGFAWLCVVLVALRLCAPLVPRNQTKADPRLR